MVARRDVQPLKKYASRMSAVTTLKIRLKSGDDTFAEPVPAANASTSTNPAPIAMIPTAIRSTI